MSNLTPFHQTLAKLNRGELNDELTETLAEVIKAVRNTRKQGTVTLTLNVAMLNARTEDTIKITPKVSTKVPELNRDESIVFSTANGDVLFEDPSQIKMELKQVEEQPKGQLKKLASAA